MKYIEVKDWPHPPRNGGYYETYEFPSCGMWNTPQGIRLVINDNGSAVMWQLNDNFQEYVKESPDVPATLDTNITGMTAADVGYLFTLMTDRINEARKDERHRRHDAAPFSSPPSDEEVLAGT